MPSMISNAATHASATIVPFTSSQSYVTRQGSTRHAPRLRGLAHEPISLKGA